MSFDPNDPKFKKWVSSMIDTAIKASMTSLIWRLPRWMLLVLLVVLISIVMYFGLYRN